MSNSCYPIHFHCPDLTLQLHKISYWIELIKLEIHINKDVHVITECYILRSTCVVGMMSCRSLKHHRSSPHIAIYLPSASTQPDHWFKVALLHSRFYFIFPHLQDVLFQSWRRHWQLFLNPVAKMTIPYHLQKPIRFLLQFYSILLLNTEDSFLSEP